MEKASTNNLVPSSFLRTLLTFIIGGFALHYMVYTVFFIYQPIWIDFIHYNPHRSQSDALLLMMQSPFDALIATLVFSTLSVLVGTIVAVVSHRIWGRVPFYSLVVMLPLCGFVTYIQGLGIPTLHDYQDFLRISLRELPVLVGCWWWSNRTLKS